MPKVCRKYERKDYSDLMQQLQSAKQEGKPIQPKAPKAQPRTAPVISPEARRRASLMGNPKMKYVISKSTGEKHDRECSCVAQIPDIDFDMVEDFPGWNSFCWKCARKAVVREGVAADIMKQLDAVMMLFSKMNASMRLIYKLFHVHGGKLFRIEPDRLFVKVREDSWIIQYTPEGCLLYHNNYYVVDEYTRVISKGFHLQSEQPMAFHFICTAITAYSWEEHVRRKKEEKIAAMQGEMESRLSGIANYAQIPRFSLFNRYILVADCNNHIERQIRRGNLHACVVVKGCYPETKCADTLFKVRKRECRCFLSIVEEAKSYSVRSKNFDYADFCENKIAQQECTPAVS